MGAEGRKSGCVGGEGRVKLLSKGLGDSGEEGVFFGVGRDRRRWDVRGLRVQR